MAAAEMFDYLSPVTPDYVTTTLSITPHGIVTEVSTRSQQIFTGVDGSELCITYNSSPIFYISWSWNILSASDSGLILDFYNDSSKANGRQRTFYLTYGDGHVYVVRFDCNLTRRGPHPSRYSVPDVRFRVLGHQVISSISSSASASPSSSISASPSSSISASITSSISASPSEAIFEDTVDTEWTDTTDTTWEDR